MSLIDTLNWRYACKKFDPDKRVREEDINFMQEAIRLSASSFGLQLYKVLVIENRELREKLKPFSWMQDKVVDASHLFVFCHYTEFTDEMSEAYAQLRADIQQKPMEEVMTYVDYMYANVSKYGKEEFNFWSSKQSYIAMSNLLTACGELKVDACPIEGFEKKVYDEMLGLKDKKLATSVLTAVGYRAEDEQNQYNVKVRRPLDELFETIK